MNNIDNQSWGNASFQATNPDGTTFGFTVSGRDRWALECLVLSGPIGCTPIEIPGPRWSGYVHNLRNLGLAIETMTESHGGPFKGNHARYVLQSIVMPSCCDTVAA